jgi:adenylate cyclase
MIERRSLTLALERGLYGSLAGALYAAFGLPPSGPLWLAVAFTGGLIGFATAQLDRLLFLTPLRRKRFWIVLSVRSLAYLLVVSLCLALVFLPYIALEERLALQTLMRSDILTGWVTWLNFPRLLFFSLMVMISVQFVTLLVRLIGPDILVNYLLGRYHQPKEEERIFMFMDLRSSTTIAERLGPMKWHNFLNDFFFDIAQPVRKTRGAIYQYVGDGVVISWPRQTGLHRLNCIHCFFDIWDKMALRRKYYLAAYGYEPIFKAGYHIGTVIVGEIGDFQRDIVFHGDAINTAARIQEECNRFNRRLLLSNTLLDQLELGKEYIAEYITTTQLPGKEEVLQLYSLDPA